jgi:hypothetical protein
MWVAQGWWRKMSGKIFISYRREDSSAWTGRLYDRLFQHFSQNEIFMDVDTIEPGVDFVEAIEEVVGACDVLIAVIGSRWVTSSDRRGRRRLDIPEDIVRLEIATALKRGIRVIPVLVEGASMPEVGELPDDLKALVRRNAVEIGHNRFNADSQRLVTALERALGKATEQRERKENERLGAQQRERLDREQRERGAAEIHERQEKEQLDARRQEHEEKERLEHEAPSQPPSPVAPSQPPAKPDSDKPSAETPKVVYPPPPKPAEPEREKPPPSSSGGTGGKRPSKQVIAFLAIAAVLAVGGLIYVAIRKSPSPPPQPAPIVAVTPSPPIPTVEEKAPPTPEVAVQPSAQPTAPVAVAVPSPSIREVTFGSGARIGTIRSINTVCCGARRGVIATPTFCSPLVATATRPIIATLISAFVVL